MKVKCKYLLISAIFILYASSSIGQRNFQFTDNLTKQSISFKLLSNLIVFPIEVNGKKLNFILDSGVGKTIIFNLKPKDSIRLKDVKKIKLHGLGSEEPVDASISRGNTFKIKSIFSNYEQMYVIDNDSFDLSSKLGLTVNGIIGYSLLKDLEVKINYSSKKITFYKKGTFNYDKCRKCESLFLQFHKLKPYINIGVKLTDSLEKITPVKLLIDSGGSDAMWLFENSSPGIKPPTNYFNDFLGEGLSGPIYGKKSRIKALVIGKFEIKKPNVSYPDSLSVAHALKFIGRNGSLGGTILKRFTVIFDYNSSKVTLKKGRNFKEPFKYNMSGIELVHNGKRLVKEKDNNTSSFSLINKAQSSQESIVILDYSYKYAFKPSYRIFKVRKGSPADVAGLVEGDVVIKINGKYTFNMSLHEITGYFFQKENKKISMVIERNGQDFEYNFYLKDILK
ncbi:PDZ domain-containing protein [Lutibacter citreus]|uniref:PDZ domain-containing protein n=1 Tax=Lutibacter citreus TaxID=2138210 RepID=UPI000DBE85C6|nr:PDZ domain-containing protein [Lutibacter citreus]